MKRLHTKLSILAFVAFALILSSCSQQRYGHRSYVKKEVVAKAEVKKQDKQEIAQLAPIQAAHEEAFESPQNATPLAIEVPVTEETKQDELSQVESRPAATGRSGLMTKVQEKAVKHVIKRLDKAEKVDSSGEINLNNKWVRLILIGLICLLLGIILPGILGELLGLVGSILIVIGLIFLILELL